MFRFICLALLLTHAVLNAETIAITNAHIYSMGPSGEIKAGTVVITQGKILAVGAQAKIPSGARIIDAKGRIVTPGLILTGTSVGAEEVPAVDSTVDSGVREGLLSAGFDIETSINPDSTLIPIARIGGNTSSVVTPSFRRVAAFPHRIFAGTAALINLSTDSELLLKSRVAMFLPAGEAGAKNGGGSRGAFFVGLKSQLNEARFYSRNKSSYDQNRSRHLSLGIDDLEALVPVVNGKLPILVEVDKASDIKQVISFAREQKIQVVLSGVAEGWRVAKEISSSNIPVLLDSKENLPSSFEAVASTFENAARLHGAGVKVSIASPSFLVGDKAARLSAGRAVAHGLSWLEGLASLTINPAKAFGVDDRIGSLEPGKNADLVIWSGDPLDVMGHADVVLIGGKEQSLDSRQTLLRDRYLASPNGYPPQYR